MTKKNRMKNARAQNSPAARNAAAPDAQAGGGPVDRARTLERRLTFRLDADRLAQLEDYARNEGFSVSLVVRHLVCRFLDDMGRSQGGRRF